MDKLPRGPKNWPKKACPECGVIFGPKRGHSTRDWRRIVFCSRGCSAKARSIPLAQRLAIRAVRNHDTGCLEWQGSRDPKGYGRIGDNAETGEFLVHRAAWALANGPIPDGLHALHHCDNPPCFEVSHLYVGTNDDNVADRHQRDRWARVRGEDNPRARLTWEQVRAIRADARFAKDIAPEYGVSKSLVGAIKRNECWIEETRRAG